MTDLIVSLVILSVLILKTILFILNKRLIPHIYLNFAFSVLLFSALAFYSAKYISPIVASPIYSLIYSPNSLQEFKIKNDSPNQEKIIAFGRKYNSDDWRLAIPQDVRESYSNIITLAPYASYSLRYAAGANDFDYIAISRLTGNDFKHDAFRAKIFKVPSIPYVVYTTEISQPLKSERISPILSGLFLAYFFCISSVLAIIYSFISLKFIGIKRIVHFSLGGLLGLAMVYIMYFLLIDIWYFL